MIFNCCIQSPFFVLNAVIKRGNIPSKKKGNAKTVANTDVTVFINGPPGTGKEVVANYIHDNSIRADKPFVAVNCAAIGCPALRPEAFVGEKLEEQLEESTKLFLADKTRNYSDGGKLYISSVFDWYGEDFEKGWQGINSVAQFLYLYAEELRLDEEMKEKLFTNQLELHYLKYDWNLNRTAPL